jgi:hypothetical protein
MKVMSRNYDKSDKRFFYMTYGASITYFFQIKPLIGHLLNVVTIQHT